MSSDLLFLWRNRERPQTFRRTIRVWAKRLFHLRATARLVLKSTLWRWKGADIGRRVVVNNGACILTAFHSLTDSAWRHKKAPVRICDYVWIASNEMVLPGVTIGRGAAVGAGAAVRNDVPEYAVVTGNPAQADSRRRTPDLAYSPVMMAAPFEAWVGANGALCAPLES